MSIILAVNSGSSSLKLAAFTTDMKLVQRGQNSNVVEWFNDTGIDRREIVGVGHRIVHGGTRFISPTLVTDQVLADLQALSSLAPLHMPGCLRVLQDLRTLVPRAPHVACFDTAFHATQPDVARRLPLPRSYHDRGFQRYGFHGLNYEHVVQALPQQTGRPLPMRLLVAHLGNGASMCAILNGRSVATTMGYSTADGLVMGTRTGAIDPGALIALMRDDAMTAADMEELVYRQSGLLGVSGMSSDMRELLASSKAQAAEAVDYYCYHAARQAGSLAIAMGGLDAVAFTGGVGENSSAVRDRIIAHLAWLNVKQVLVVRADEELVIAGHVKNLLSK
jgi:acetate kinase